MEIVEIVEIVESWSRGVVRCVRISGDDDEVGEAQEREEEEPARKVQSTSRTQEPRGAAVRNEEKWKADERRRTSRWAWVRRGYVCRRLASPGGEEETDSKGSVLRTHLERWPPLWGEPMG